MTTAAPMTLLGYIARYVGDSLDHDLAQIAAQSQRNNPRNSLTGALVYDQGFFIQLIEGPSNAVTALLGRVMADPRCADVQVLMARQITQRSLGEWAMLVLRTDGTGGVAPFALPAFQKAYRHAINLDVATFVDQLRQLVPHDAAPADPDAPRLRLLAYVARYTGTHLDHDLAEIATKSHANNGRDDLTGELVYDRGQFVQFVEGPSHAVGALVERIRHDPRCADLRVLFDRWVDHRSSTHVAMRALRTDRDPPPAAPLQAFRMACDSVIGHDADRFVSTLRALFPMETDPATPG